MTIDLNKKAIDESLKEMLEGITKSLPEGIDIAILKDLTKAVNRNDKEMAVKAISHIDRVMNKVKEKAVLINRIDELNKEREGLENTDINELVDDLEERYCEMLDEVYPAVEMGNLSWSPSDVLRKMDPIAYNMGLSEYEDSLASEINDLPEWDRINEEIEEIEETTSGITEEIEEIDEEISEMIYWGIHYKG